MISASWVEKRKPHWERLDRLTGLAARGLGALNRSDLRDLGLLYRQTAADLAAVSEDPANARLAGWLNGLLGRSHNVIYLGHRPKAVPGIVSFYTRTYPRLFRELLWRTLLAFAIFIAAAAAGWVLTLRDPSFAHRVVGEQLMSSIEKHRMWTDSIVSIQPLASSFITSNNLSVAFGAFALGITLVGTAYMMLLNGLNVGVVSAAAWKGGMAVSVWSFIAPHGSLELPAIIIAGGAGFELAAGLLLPGTLPRRESLTRSGARAARLLLGAIPLLLVAGTIEGFFSPSAAPASMKFTLGALLFAALLAWLFGAGRGSTESALHGGDVRSFPAP